jgi:putative ABC transport system permease protein
MVWFIEIVWQAWAQIRSYALRSFLTALGIVIAVTGVITIAGVMTGLQTNVNRELSKLGSENITIGPNFVKVLAHKQVNDIGRREADALRAHIQGISTVVSTASAASVGSVQYGNKKQAVSVLAASDQLPELYKLYPIQGRFLMENDEAAHMRVCVISQHLIAQLGLPDNPLGTQLQFGRLSLRIIGVMPGDGNTGGAIAQIGGMYIPFSVAQELTGKTLSRELGFRITDPGKHELILQKVKQVLRQSMRTMPDEEDDFKINDAVQIRQANNTILAMISVVLSLVVSVSLVVGGIGIMNVMLVSVTERTREIGILRALGATQQQIRVQFLVEAAILSGLGALLGIALGWILANLIALFVPNADGASLPLWAVLSSVGSAVAVGLISGALPAARAAELDPVVALSKE